MNDNENIQLGQIGSEQFVVAEYILLDSELIGSDEKILYLVLKRFKNRNAKYCYPSLSTLEKKLNWTRKTLLKKIENLVQVGLIKKISNKSPKLNNQYIIYPVGVVLGGKQLSLSDLTEDETELLSEIPEGQVIKNENTGKITICASEKLAFTLKTIYKRIELFADTIRLSAGFEETSVIIDDIKRFYEGIASCPFVVLDKRITDDCDKIDSETYLNTVKDFDFESIVEIVRKVKKEGVPEQFKDNSEQIYILSYLWLKREFIMQNSLGRKIEEANRNISALKVGI